RGGPRGAAGCGQFHGRDLARVLRNRDAALHGAEADPDPRIAAADVVGQGRPQECRRMIALAPALERFLAPQERVDVLRDQALRHGGSLFADLAYANSYDGPLPEVLTALRNAIDGAGRLALQYTPYGGTTVARRLVAESLRASHGQPFHLKDVVLTPGAMA